MVNEFELLDRLFRLEPSVAIENHFITLAVHHHNVKCLETLLDAICAAHDHEKLLDPNLIITQEIVQASIIFPQAVKKFLKDLPLMKIAVTRK